LLDHTAETEIKDTDLDKRETQDHDPQERCEICGGWFPAYKINSDGECPNCEWAGM
jgi:hypothetical protein